MAKNTKIEARIEEKLLEALDDPEVDLDSLGEKITKVRELASE